MARVRRDNDARYALRASFVDENGDVITGDTITIGGDSRISDTDISNWNTAYGWGDHSTQSYITNDVTLKDQNYMNLAISTSDSDPNTNTSAWFLTNHSNSPGLGYYWHIQNYTWSNGGGNRSQIATSYNSTVSRMYTRQLYSGAWTAWREVAYTDGTVANANTATTATTATTFSTNRGNYKGVTDGAVAGQLMWKNYGNVHTIFDASQGTAPTGTSVNNTNSTVPWSATYPTLMGWNGSSTYGVRVDSARVSDSCSGNSATATTATNVTGISRNVGNYGSISANTARGGYYGFSCNGRLVLMNNGGADGGLYNDTHNRWILNYVESGTTGLYHAGVQKGYTYGSGWRVTGNMLATSNVYAYYSDKRLKDVKGQITDALDKVDAIETFYYTHNDTARDLGYEGEEMQTGVAAQSVQAVMTEVVHSAPIDDDVEGGS